MLDWSLLSSRKGWNMPRGWQQQGLHYATALLAVGVALSLTVSLRPLGRSPSALFFAAVTISACYGGWGPGLAAAILSVAALDFWFQSPLTPLSVHFGNLIRLAAFGLVSVLIVALHARGQHLQKTLRHQDRRKDEFLALLAHELRSPLSAATCSLAVLRLANAGPGTVTQAQGVLERQLHHMDMLIEDLLDVSRISQGKIRLHKQTVDFTRLVAQAVEIAQPALEARQHHLELSVPPGPLWLEADPTRMVQIIANLLVNAAKFTNRGGRIELAVEPNQKEISLSVRDNGMGIAAEVLPHVFDLFYQSEKGASGGLGLGLHLVRGLVELHGGQIAAFSEGPGRGSEFLFHLDRAGQ